MNLPESRGVFSLSLNEYQAANLLWLLELLMERPVYNELSTGDWVGEIRWMLEDNGLRESKAANRPWGEVS